MTKSFGSKITTFLMVIFAICLTAPWSAAAGGRPTIAIGTSSATLGSTISVPITISNISGTGIEVESWELGITYNPSILTPVSVTQGSLIPGPYFDCNLAAAKNGVSLSWNSNFWSYITSDGTLATVTFNVLSNAPGGPTPLTLSSVGSTVLDVTDVESVDITSNFSFTNGSINVQVPAPALTVTSAIGTACGTTAVTATPNTTGDTLAVQVSTNSIITPNVGDPTPAGSAVTNPYTSGSDISGVAASDYVGVYDLSSSGTVVAFTQIQLDSADINLQAPALNSIPTAAPGTAYGTTAVTATPNTAGDTLVVEVSTTSITTPNVGDTAPTGSGVTNPYQSGSNISGVSTSDYVGVYELNSGGTLVAFTQIQLVSDDINSQAPAAPAISPNGCNITTSGTAGIDATLSAGQAIYYTINPGDTGVMPATSSAVYSIPFIVSASAGIYTVDAAVYDSGTGLWSDPASATFTVSTPQAATPVVSSISTDLGPISGGTTVTIAGTGFTSDATVSSGNTAATITNIASNGTTITVTSPVVTEEGQVDITVKTAGGTSDTSSADQFTYFIYGDVNGTGKINSGDATLVLRYCARLTTLTSLQLIVADVNGGSNVNSGDATLILRYAARLISTFPVQS